MQSIWRYNIIDFLDKYYKITTGFFTENAIVVAEGEMLIDGIFQVRDLHPSDKVAIIAYDFIIALQFVYQKLHMLYFLRLPNTNNLMMKRHKYLECSFLEILKCIHFTYWYLDADFYNFQKS